MFKKEGVTVIAFDLDNLKEINTKFGYSIGDLYIKKSCQAICNCLENKYYPVRVGGDEFLIFIPGKKDLKIRPINMEITFKDESNSLKKVSYKGFTCYIKHFPANFFQNNKNKILIYYRIKHNCLNKVLDIKKLKYPEKYKEREKIKINRIMFKKS
jgi:GGDEF domain-containing protein